MKGLQPLSYILVKTLIGDDGYYKVDRQDGGPPVGSYKKRKRLKGLDLLLDLEIANIVIYDSKKKYLGFISWNSWNEGSSEQQQSLPSNQLMNCVVTGITDGKNFNKGEGYETSKNKMF